MEIRVDNYQWHEFFPNVLTHNIGVVIAIWAPIVLVYFMDAQIWYAIFSTLFGGIHGAFSYLGEIRTLRLLRSRFEAIPAAFSCRLMPSASKDTKRKDLGQDEAREWKNNADFSNVWNEFIHAMRMEDLISNRERDLLLVPYSSDDITWRRPRFLLASKISIALDMAKDFKGKDHEELFKKIRGDDYMHSAVIECYETVRDIIFGLLEDEADKKILRQICDEVGSSIQEKIFLNNFKMSELPMLGEKLEKFLKLLQADSDNISTSQIINVLQDIFEILTKDIMVGGHESLESAHSVQNLKKEQRFGKLNIDLIENKSWRDKVDRLYLLLTVKESEINVPQNSEARHRITFFANSLFMNMPSAPKVRDMISFSVLTPYYKEDVLFPEAELERENEDGISILVYLQKIYPDEWLNFQQRINDPQLTEKEKMDLTCHWVSYRGQTLSRTVRGMMYYRKALELQCFLEYAGDDDIFRDYRNFEEETTSFGNAQALADLKFTYVVSCQVYGKQKKSDDPRDLTCYRCILRLLLKYPSLRVAYIDESEETKHGKSRKSYFSVLVKGGDKLDEQSMDSILGMRKLLLECKDAINKCVERLEVGQTHRRPGPMTGVWATSQGSIPHQASWSSRRYW